MPWESHLSCTASGSLDAKATCRVGRVTRHPRSHLVDLDCPKVLVGSYLIVLDPLTGDIFNLRPLLQQPNVDIISLRHLGSQGSALIPPTTSTINSPQPAHSLSTPAVEHPITKFTVAYDWSELCSQSIVIHTHNVSLTNSMLFVIDPVHSTRTRSITNSYWRYKLKRSIGQPAYDRTRTAA